MIEPGDVVVVEVDAPHSAKTYTSGGLRTTVAQGDVPFDGALGSLPAVDDLQRAEAWGSREEAGLPPEDPSTEAAHPQASSTETTEAAHPQGSLSEDGEADRDETPRTAPRLSDELRTRLLAAPTAGLSAQLRKRGLHHCFIDGVSANLPGAKIVGTAKTLRFVPAREDLFASHGGGYNAQKRAFDTVEEGEVIVIEARGDATSGTLGDILALRAKARRAAGVVTDGGVRDFAAVAEIGLPVFSQGAHPSVLGRRHVPWDVDVTIACGGAAVQPGDVIVGDADGVVVIPPALVEEVVDATLAQEDEDAWIAEQVESGHPVDGLFPMNAAWRATYEAWLADGREGRR